VYSILNIVVVDINVFSTLIVILSFNKLKRELVIAVELNRVDVVADIANLLEEVGKLYSFFSSVRKSNVLSFSCRGCNKLLFA
jgi:hypothetical protein